VANVASVARPLVVLRFGDPPRSHKMEMQVARKFQRIGASLDKDCLLSSLEQMARPLPFNVDIRRACTIDMSSSRTYQRSSPCQKFRPDPSPLRSTIPLAAVPTQVSSFRLLTLACRMSDAGRKRLIEHHAREATGVKRGVYSRCIKPGQALESWEPATFLATHLSAQRSLSLLFEPLTPQRCP
jgi:hypothetical protein